MPVDDLSPERATSLLREYNRWMLQILNIHEAIPGHYAQLVYGNKSPSRIKAIFGNGAMVEGWAVYGERMMLERYRRNVAYLFQVAIALGLQHHSRLFGTCTRYE
jgi:hypothetical protein